MYWMGAEYDCTRACYKDWYNYILSLKYVQPVQYRHFTVGTRKSIAKCTFNRGCFCMIRVRVLKKENRGTDECCYIYVCVCVCSIATKVGVDYFCPVRFCVRGNHAHIPWCVNIAYPWLNDLKRLHVRYAMLYILCNVSYVQYSTKVTAPYLCLVERLCFLLL